MNTFCAAGAALAFIAISSGPAWAGCATGAVVGGVAGHMAGHHAAVGAAAGCAIGHHNAVKKQAAKAPAPAAQPH
jgi:hypothetical protein